MSACSAGCSASDTCTGSPRYCRLARIGLTMKNSNVAPTTPGVRYPRKRHCVFPDPLRIQVFVVRCQTRNHATAATSSKYSSGTRIIATVTRRRPNRYEPEMVLGTMVPEKATGLVTPDTTPLDPTIDIGAHCRSGRLSNPPSTTRDNASSVAAQDSLGIELRGAPRGNICGNGRDQGEERGHGHKGRRV